MNRTDTHLITLTMTEGHWLRIRAALLCAAEDLAQAGSGQEAQYKHSYDLVRLGLEPWIGGPASTLALRQHGGGPGPFSAALTGAALNTLTRGTHAHCL